MSKAIPPTPIGNGLLVQTGDISFVGSATSVQIPSPFRQTLFVSVMPLTAPNTNERLFLSATPSNGVIPRESGGTVTVYRNGTKTVNLPIQYEIKGR